MRCLKLLKLFCLGTLYHVKNTVLARLLQRGSWYVLIYLHLALIRLSARYLWILRIYFIHSACNLIVLQRLASQVSNARVSRFLTVFNLERIKTRLGLKVRAHRGLVWLRVLRTQIIFFACIDSHIFYAHRVCKGAWKMILLHDLNAAVFMLEDVGGRARGLCRFFAFWCCFH